MNELVKIEQPSVPAFSYGDIERIAGAFAKSGMFGVRDPAAALTLCLMAQAEGQHPAAAFRDYSIVQGRPAKKAEAMLRDFLTSGGKVKWLELTDTCAKAEFSHPAGGSAVIDWTMERAKTAGLGTKDNWKKYARQMLRSRTVSEGVRTVCPMATSGLYVPEEVADFGPQKDAVRVTEDGEIVEGEIVEREPVKGIHAIKERLRTLQTDGDKAETLDDFNALVKQHATDLTTIKEAQHEWWTGDGEDFEGFRAWIKRRREELTPKEASLTFQLLVSNLNECDSTNELQGFLGQHGDAVGMLDGEEARTFEALYDERERSLKAVDTVTVGG